MNFTISGRQRLQSAYEWTIESPYCTWGALPEEPSLDYMRMVCAQLRLTTGIQTLTGPLIDQIRGVQR